MIMLALSIRQPWAWAILHAGKDVENRTWMLPLFFKLPQRIVIHAGKKEDPEGYAFLKQMHIIPPANLPTGCLVGEVDITGSAAYEYPEHTRPRNAQVETSHWAFGPYCFTLANPKAYKEPIPYRGALKFFKVEVPEGLAA